MGCKHNRLYKKLFHKNIEEKLFKTKHQCDFYINQTTLKQKCSYSYVKHSLKIINDSINFEITRNDEKYTVSVDCFYGGIFNLKISDKIDRFICNADIGENLKKSNFNSVLEQEESIEINSQDEPFFIMFDNLNHLVNSNVNKYKLVFTFKSNEFLIHYFINDLKTITFNAQRTLHLKNVSNNISFDITFHDSLSLYGLPLRMTELSLKPTDQESGYRLFNLDCAEQIPGHYQSLYGSIPIVHSLKTDGNHITSAFFHNPSDTWVDLSFEENQDKSLKYVTEGGIINLYLYSDNNFNRLFYKQSLITGFSKLPPIFALGYHQCRWSYMNQGEVDELITNFENYEIPYDVIWLDIDHTDKKKYFTWDKVAFPKPEEFIDKLNQTKRKLVTIIDPHISTVENYPVSEELIQNGMNRLNTDCVVKKPNNELFVGKCWPGDSFYADFLNPKLEDIWKKFFLNEDYFLNMNNIHTWIDMNEPSVFTSIEITMPKENLHFDGVKQIPHSLIHNIYGYSYHKVTYSALKNRYKELDLRPFILSRSFYAGSQKWGFIWTGDNNASFESMKYSVDQLLSLNLCGYSACGADVGGFFNNPDEKLTKSWYQYGAFNPFFRGHAHEATKRREPWCFPEQTRNSIKDSIILRYKLILFWYTIFFENSITSLPVMNPFWVKFKKFAREYYNYCDSFVVGDKFIIVPFLNKKRELSIPSGHCFYEFNTGEIVKNNLISLENEDTLIYVIGGSIIPLISKPRMCSYYTIRQNITLNIYLDNEMKAEGSLYLDDGETFGYRNGEFIYLSISFKEMSLQIKQQNSSYTDKGNFFSKLFFEEIKIYGLKLPEEMNFTSTSSDIKYQKTGNHLSIKGFNVKVGDNVSLKVDISLNN